MTKNSQSPCFDRAADVIRLLQSAEWKKSHGENHTTALDLSKISPSLSSAEIQMIVPIVCMVLSGTSGSCHAVIDRDSSDVRWDLMRADISAFKQDKSLELESASPRQPTHQFEPKNLRQSLEFTRWKESQKWIAKDNGDGYHYTVPFSHGLRNQAMFMHTDDMRKVNEFFREQKKIADKKQPENWEHGAVYPYTNNVPQIWNNSDNQLWIPQEHAKTILVDFIGLDAKVLGIQSPQTVRG